MISSNLFLEEYSYDDGKVNPGYLLSGQLGALTLRNLSQLLQTQGSPVAPHPAVPSSLGSITMAASQLTLLPLSAHNATHDAIQRAAQYPSSLPEAPIAF